MTILRVRSDESGAAMLTALLAVVILSGLALVFMNRANTETRASANSRDHEAAIHVSEAASDRQVAAANEDDEHVTTDRAGNRIEMSPSSVADEEAWARGLLDVMRPDEATGVASDAWTELEGGQSFAVRPWDLDADEPMNVVYSVGAVPSFDAPNRKIRVVKIQIDQDHYIPEFALLTQGSLTFGGNASIVVPGCDLARPLETCTADVHTNETFTNPGNASSIEGRISQAEGTCPSSVTAVNDCVDSSDGVETKEVPEFSARDFYNRDDDLNPDPEGQSVDWFDLCPPGKPAAGATVRLPGIEPCLSSSAQVWPAPDADPTGFRGWKWQAGEWRGQSIEAGVFYIYHADATVTGSAGSAQRAVSILVEQNPSNLSGSGALAISGNPQMQSALESVLFVADADLDLSGNATGGTCGQIPSGFSGFIGVGEQLKVMGTVNLRGSIIVQDLADVHGLVKRNNDGVQGTMCLEYDDNLAVDFTGRWVITFWNEI